MSFLAALVFRDSCRLRFRAVMTIDAGGHSPTRSPARHRPAIVLLGVVLATICGAVAGAVPSQSGVASGPARRAARPNILWFIADDASPYLGAYGDPVARTPTIDGLAEHGIRFGAVYSDAPVCAPSRFTLITGLHSASAAPAHHMRATAVLPASVRGWPELLRRAGYYTVNNLKTDYNADVDVQATWDDSSGTAHWRNRHPGEPFFEQVTSLTRHELSTSTTLPGATAVDAVTIPPFYPDTPTTRTDKAQYYDRIAQMDSEVAQRLAELDADGLADDTIV